MLDFSFEGFCQMVCKQQHQQTKSKMVRSTVGTFRFMLLPCFYTFYLLCRSLFSIVFFALFSSVRYGNGNESAQFIVKLVFYLPWGNNRTISYEYMLHFSKMIEKLHILMFLEVFASRRGRKAFCLFAKFYGPHTRVKTPKI